MINSKSSYATISDAANCLQKMSGAKDDCSLACIAHVRQRGLDALHCIGQSNTNLTETTTIVCLNDHT
jgi:hypothetical protein